MRMTLPCLLLAFAAAASAAPPPDLEDYVARAMSATGAPAVAIAITEKGKTTLAKAWGVRKLGESKPADEHTVFPIGSNTKQFTATALAMLVDEGKLSWDDKVATRLPGFQMYDAYTTGEMTVKDLLVHNSGLGLGAGDLMLFPSTTRSRQDVVEALRYLKPARSFRSGYAYDNVLYLAAGRLVDVITHGTWEDFIEDRVFKPLGMKDSRPSWNKPGSNFGWPHTREGGMSWMIGGKVAPMKTLLRVDELVDPAGGILASAEDMAKWLEVQLAHGALPDGKRLFSEAQSATLWTPVTLTPVPPPRPGPLGAVDPQFAAYALGFSVHDFRGHKIISHGGGVIGGVSTTVLIPELHVGFAVMTNSMEAAALRSIELHLLDSFFGAPATDYTPLLLEQVKGMGDKAAAVLKAMPADAGSGPPPSLPLAKYAGVYRDPWYGTISIKEAGKGLVISFDRSPGMSGPLEPVRNDTFRTRWTDPLIEDAYVTFTLKPDGSIDRATMKAISPLADFSFDYQDLVLTPQPPKPPAK